MSTNPDCCPRCKSTLVTRNGEGEVIECLTLQHVEDVGEVCEHCRKALALTADRLPTRKQLMSVHTHAWRAYGRATDSRRRK